MVSVSLSVFFDQGNSFWNQGNIREKSGNFVSNDWQKPCCKVQCVREKTENFE